MASRFPFVIERACEGCGELMVLTVTAARSYRERQRFCSRQCSSRRGLGHGNVGARKVNRKRRDLKIAATEYDGMTTPRVFAIDCPQFIVSLTRAIETPLSRYPTWGIPRVSEQMRRWMHSGKGGFWRSANRLPIHGSMARP